MRIVKIFLCCLIFFIAVGCQNTKEKKFIKPSEDGVQCINNCFDNEMDINTKLLLESGNGNLDIVKQLIQAGADVNAKDDLSGLTTLMIAIGNRHLDITKELIGVGADVNAKNDVFTALILATGDDNIEIVKELIKSGADVNAKTNDGTTALIIAKERGNKEIIELLKQAGAKE